MDKSKYSNDLQQIRELMTQANSFISLSGLSGISTGIIALIGSFVAYKSVFAHTEYFVHEAIALPAYHFQILIGIAIATFTLSIFSAIFFTRKMNISRHEKMLNVHSQRLLINLAIPLATGGLLSLLLLSKGFVGMLPAITLIFYGMALINASKYTVASIRNLGLIQIVLGLLAFQFINYALWFWALGFGVFQIIYGLMIQRKN